MGMRNYPEDVRKFLPILRDTSSATWLEIGDTNLSDCFVIEKAQFPTLSSLR
jgi:hypothetical protein